MKSLDDRDTPVLGRLMTKVGTPTISEIWVSLSNNQEKRRVDHFSSEDLRCLIYRPHGLSVVASKHGSASGFKAFIEPWKKERFPSKSCKEEMISLIKAFIKPWEREYSPSEMRVGGMISFVNEREVISTSGKKIILLVISQKAVGLGKGTTF